MKSMSTDKPMSDQLKAQCDRAFEKYEAARKRLKVLRGDMDKNKKHYDEAKQERKEWSKFLRDNCPGYLVETRRRTEDEAKAAIERLAYEIKMLTRTASYSSRKLKRKRTKVVRNALVHSFLLAVRNLHEFFFSTNDHADTIYAKTFIESWELKKPNFREGFHWHRVEENEEGPKSKDFFSIISQRLHHITWARVKESKLNWHEQAITNEFLVPIRKFRTAFSQEWPTVDIVYFEASVSELEETCKRFERQQ